MVLFIKFVIMCFSNKWLVFIVVVWNYIVWRYKFWLEVIKWKVLWMDWSNLVILNILGCVEICLVLIFLICKMELNIFLRLLIFLFIDFVSVCILALLLCWVLVSNFSVYSGCFKLWLIVDKKNCCVLWVCLIWRFLIFNCVSNLFFLCCSWIDFLKVNEYWLV